MCLASPEIAAPDRICLPLTVRADAITRADAEMSKRLSDVACNFMLQNPKKGDEHYVLGSIA